MSQISTGRVQKAVDNSVPREEDGTKAGISSASPRAGAEPRGQKPQLYTSAPPPQGRGRWGIGALIALAWLALNLRWLSQDHGLPDGDEQGHIGAAWLFVGDLRAGDLLGFTQRALSGDMGEYPALYPAITGLVWAALGVAQPDALALRAANLLWLLGAAAATGRLARRAAASDRRDLAEIAAFGAVLLSPLANGLARHFMPEGALVAAAPLCALALTRARELPSAGRLLAAGIALGLGFLVKQTFLFYVFGLALLCLAPLGRAGLLAQGVAALIAAPWYISHLGDQWRYGASSVGARAALGIGAHLGYYPFVMTWEGLGPPLALLLLLCMGRLPTLPSRGLTLITAAALGGLALTLVPKKYPRLVAPLAPFAAMALAGAVAHGRRPGLVMAGGGAAAGAWLVWSSWTALPTPPLELAMDAGCPQRWLGPPQPDDFGLPAVAEAVAAAPPGPVWVIAPPEIPCEVATALPWMEHLRPWLDRAGLDREVSEVAPGADERGAALIVDWTEGAQGTRIAVPALASGFSLRGPQRSW